MKALFFVAVAMIFAGCFTPEESGDGAEEVKYSTAEQKIVVCASDCLPPTYNGNPVACASNIYCASDAAGAYCLNNDGSWSNYFCAAGGSWCGDGICNGNETYQTCADCPPPTTWCGDGICNGNETYQTCADCPPPATWCGDGICNGNETFRNCRADCPRDPPPCPGCPIP